MGRPVRYHFTVYFTGPVASVLSLFLSSPATSHTFESVLHSILLCSRNNLATTNADPSIASQASRICRITSEITSPSNIPSSTRCYIWAGSRSLGECGPVVCLVPAPLSGLSAQSWYISFRAYSTISSLNILNRYFGQKMIWYLHSKRLFFVCVNFLKRLICTSLISVVPYREVHYKIFLQFLQTVKPFWDHCQRQWFKQ